MFLDRTRTDQRILNRKLEQSRKDGIDVIQFARGVQLYAYPGSEFHGGILTEAISEGNTVDVDAVFTGRSLG